MTDYTKTTNFTAKDSLSTGDPNKVIKGSEHDTEFDNIETAVNSKLNSSRFPNLSGNVTATQTELNLLDGVTATTAEINVLDDFQEEESVSLSGDFDFGETIKAVRQGNVVTITSDGILNHSSSQNPVSTGTLSAGLRPSSAVSNVSLSDSLLVNVTVNTSGTFELFYRDYTGAGSARTNSFASVTISYVITGNVS